MNILRNANYPILLTFAAKINKKAETTKLFMFFLISTSKRQALF